MIYGNITNCTVVGHGVSTGWQCRLGYQIISEDASTNTRQIKLQLEARTTDKKYTTIGWTLTPTIDGTPLTSIGMNFTQANVGIWQVLGTRIISIVGAYNDAKSGSFTTNTSNDYALKSGSASVNIVLEDLHNSPIITSVDFEEMNGLLDRYTGIAQFLSVKNFTFQTTTFDDATISSYQVYHNGVMIGNDTSNGMTINFNDVGTLATFEMNGKMYSTLRFVVIDSYGTSGYLEKQYEVTKYTKPNLVQTSSNIKRNGQLSGKVKLSLTGTFFNQLVNDIANTISLKFAYWKKGEAESTTYYNIPFTPTDSNITLYDWAVAKNGTEITDIDKDCAYNFKIVATDRFGRASEITLLCPVGEYLWAEFKDRVDFKNITIKGKKLTTDKNITTLDIENVAVTTAADYTLLTYEIEESGTYLITGISHLNRYGQTGRQINIYLQKNGTDFFVIQDVMNGGWTVSVSINAMEQFETGDTLTLYLENGGGSKQWANGGGQLQLVKL